MSAMVLRGITTIWGHAAIHFQSSFVFPYRSGDFVNPKAESLSLPDA